MLDSRSNNNIVIVIYLILKMLNNYKQKDLSIITQIIKILYNIFYCDILYNILIINQLGLVITQYLKILSFIWLELIIN